MQPTKFENSIGTLTEQRDALIKSLIPLRTENGTLSAQNKQLTISNSQIVFEIKKHEGEIMKIKQFEIERGELLSKEIADLHLEKSVLSTEVVPMRDEASKLREEISTLSATITALNLAYQYTVQQASGLNQTIKNIVRINVENTNDVNHLILKLKEVLVQLTNK